MKEHGKTIKKVGILVILVSIASFYALNSFGKYAWPNGERFEGNFKDNQRNG